MRKIFYIVNPLVSAVIVGALLLVVSVYCTVNYRNHKDRTPVLLQQNLLDRTAMKVVPVYPDERDTDVRERLLASVECSPYLILDEGVSTWMFHESTAGENYYLYVKYQCTEQS